MQLDQLLLVLRFIVNAPDRLSQFSSLSTRTGQPCEGMPARSTEIESTIRLIRTRFVYLLAAAVIVIAGLASRRYREQLPAFLADYAGDALWALMLFLLVSTLLAGRPTLVRGLTGKRRLRFRQSACVQNFKVLLTGSICVRIARARNKNEWLTVVACAKRNRCRFEN